MSASVSGFGERAIPHAQPARASLAQRVAALALIWLSVTFATAVTMPPPLALAFSSITLIVGLILVFSSDNPPPQVVEERHVEERHVHFHASQPPVVSQPWIPPGSPAMWGFTSPPPSTVSAAASGTRSWAAVASTPAANPALQGPRASAQSRPTSLFTTPGTAVSATPASAAAGPVARARVLPREDAAASSAPARGGFATPPEAKGLRALAGTRDTALPDAPLPLPTAPPAGLFPSPLAAHALPPAVEGARVPTGIRATAVAFGGEGLGTSVENLDTEAMDPAPGSSTSRIVGRRPPPLPAHALTPAAEGARAPAGRRPQRT